MDTCPSGTSELRYSCRRNITAFLRGPVRKGGRPRPAAHPVSRRGRSLDRPYGRRSSDGLRLDGQPTQLHKAGRLRVLATSDKERSPFLPDVPTFQEVGYNIEGRGWFGVFGPAGTPAGTVERLNRLIVSAIQAPEVQKRILALGLQPTGTSAATSRSSRKRMRNSGALPWRHLVSQRTTKRSTPLLGVRVFISGREARNFACIAETLSAALTPSFVLPVVQEVRKHAMTTPNPAHTLSI